MQFAFSANAFQEYDPAETIAILSEIGYSGVELLLGGSHLHPDTTSAADIATVTETLAQTGVEISNCNAFMISAEDFQHPSYIEEDVDYRQDRIDYTRKAVRLADTFGADSISIQPGGPIPEGKSRDWGMETFVNAMRKIGPTAQQHGVDVLVEPEPDLLIETSEQYLDFAGRLNDGTTGCNFDAGHLFCAGEDPATAVARLADHTPHYHLEDIPANRRHEHTQLGDGAMDIDDFLQAVEDTGYDGFVTVELYPYQETAAETARNAYAYLDEHGWV